jgi:hypothetical protein
MILVRFLQRIHKGLCQKSKWKKRNIYLMGLGIPMEQNYAHLQKAPFSEEELTF